MHTDRVTFTYACRVIAVILALFGIGVMLFVRGQDPLEAVVLELAAIVAAVLSR